MDAQLLVIAMNALTKKQRWQDAIEIFHQVGAPSGLGTLNKHDGFNMLKAGMLEIYCNNTYVCI